MATNQLSQARQLETRLAVISLLVSFGISTSLALYTSRHITRPLLQASQVAQQVSETNNFNLRVSTVNRDEVGILAHSFNQLLNRVQGLLNEQQQDKQQLKQYSRQLETTVEQRTAELIPKKQDLKAALQYLKTTQSQLIQAEKMSGLG